MVKKTVRHSILNYNKQIHTLLIRHLESGWDLHICSREWNGSEESPTWTRQPWFIHCSWSSVETIHFGVPPFMETSILFHGTDQLPEMKASTAPSPSVTGLSKNFSIWRGFQGPYAWPVDHTCLSDMTTRDRKTCLVFSKSCETPSCCK